MDNMKWDSVETLSYIMIVDKLIAMRPQYKDIITNYSMDKIDTLADKCLGDSDVYFAVVSVSPGASILSVD